jgi:uncharacterized protein
LGQSQPTRLIAIQCFVILILTISLAASGLAPKFHSDPKGTKPADTAPKANAASTQKLDSELVPTQSIYVSMHDGVRLAVDVYLPATMGSTTRVPTIFLDTRYGRRWEAKYRRPTFFLENGYAMVVVDARGTGASFGIRPIELFSGEVDDMRELIGWIAKQPWSNGKVAVTGVSYSADSGDLATTTGAPPLKAAFLRSSEIDPYLQLLLPGGVRNDAMFREWNQVVATFDMGLDCLNDRAKCDTTRGLTPVADDTDYTLARAALKEHLLNGPPEDLLAITYRDDKTPAGYTMLESGAASRIRAMQSASVPTQYWASWVDGGTADSALSRYVSAPDVPMEIYIEATNHAERKAADPFFVAGGAPQMSLDDVFATNLDFLNRVMVKGETIRRQIHYVVMGVPTWETTTTWPPQNVAQKVWKFDASNHLAVESQPVSSGEDRYQIDYSATTGRHTRWSTQYGPPTDYGDRADETSKLLNYVSDPFPEDMEIVGNAVVRLRVASDYPDVAFFVYLEDVSPDGRVTYLTEGLLRSIHRKVTSAPLPYQQSGPLHSFNRADRDPLIPGETAEVAFSLFPTAALIRKGHCLEVSIAGADADTFQRYPREGNPTWRIFRGGASPSEVIVPVRPWQQ